MPSGIDFENKRFNLRSRISFHQQSVSALIDVVMNIGDPDTAVVANDRERAVELNPVELLGVAKIDCPIKKSRRDTRNTGSPNPADLAVSVHDDRRRIASVLH